MNSGDKCSKRVCQIRFRHNSNSLPAGACDFLCIVRVWYIYPLNTKLKIILKRLSYNILTLYNFNLLNKNKCNYA